MSLQLKHNCFNDKNVTIRTFKYFVDHFFHSPVSYREFSRGSILRELVFQVEYTNRISNLLNGDFDVFHDSPSPQSLIIVALP